MKKIVPRLAPRAVALFALFVIQPSISFASANATAGAALGCSKWCEIPESGFPTCHGTGGDSIRCVANGDACVVEPCNVTRRDDAEFNTQFLADDGLHFEITGDVRAVHISGFERTVPRVWSRVAESEYIADDGCKGLITGRAMLPVAASAVTD